MSENLRKLVVALLAGVIILGVGYMWQGLARRHEAGRYDVEVDRLMADWAKGDKCGWTPRYFLRDDDGVAVARSFWGSIDSWKIKRQGYVAGRAWYAITIVTKEKVHHQVRLLFEPNLGRTEITLMRERDE